MVMISPFAIALLNILTNHTMLQRKKSIKYCVIAFLINTVMAMALMTYCRINITNPVVFKYASYSVASSYIVYIYLVFSDAFSVKLFAMCSTWVFSTIIMSISNLGYDVVGDINMNATMVQGIRMFLQLVLLILAAKWFGEFFKTILKKISVQIIYLMSGYMILALLLLMDSIKWNGNIFGNNIPILNMLLLISFIILGYLIVFFGIASASKNKLLKINLDELENQQIDMHQKLMSNDKELFEAGKLKDKIVATEMAFLQAQIKPHFLYNALNAIANVSEKNGQEGSMLILDLAIYLRGSLAFNNLDKMVTIEKELEFVKTYFNIEQARFGEKIQLKFQIEVPYHDQIPVFILQPLVENAVRHGISKKVSGGTVSIKIVPSDQGIKVEVIDDGVGIDDEVIASILHTKGNNTGIGIINIHQRLMTLYNEGLYIESELNKGTRICFTMPQRS